MTLHLQNADVYFFISKEVQVVLLWLSQRQVLDILYVCESETVSVFDKFTYLDKTENMFIILYLVTYVVISDLIILLIKSRKYTSRKSAKNCQRKNSPFLKLHFYVGGLA